MSSREDLEEIDIKHNDINYKGDSDSDTDNENMFMGEGMDDEDENNSDEDSDIDSVDELLCKFVPFIYDNDTQETLINVQTDIRNELKEMHGTIKELVKVLKQSQTQASSSSSSSKHDDVKKETSEEKKERRHRKKRHEE